MYQYLLLRILTGSFLMGSKIMTQLICRPPIIAHRGASAYAPENTMAAFIAAMQLGAKWIEFDVRQAACGELIIFHDETLNRTTNGGGLVSQYPYAYLRTLDAGSWFSPYFTGERIPILRQVADFLAATHINANVELKAMPGKEEELVLNTLHALAPYLHQPHFSLLFSSFSLETLYFLRQHAPDCLLGLLINDMTFDWKKQCAALACASVHVNQALMTKAFANEIKADNKALFCYTVNDLVRAQSLFGFGVDAVFTDTLQGTLFN